MAHENSWDMARPELQSSHGFHGFHGILGFIEISEIRGIRGCFLFSKQLSENSHQGFEAGFLLDFSGLSNPEASKAKYLKK
jgi:hypothetical protein